MTKQVTEAPQVVMWPPLPTSPKQGWAKRIADAKERGDFTFEDTYKASRWDKCAVGELDVIHVGDNSSEEPEDEELNHLGLEFCVAVRDDDVAEAEDVYNQIHQRYQQITT